MHSNLALGLNKNDSGVMVFLPTSVQNKIPAAASQKEKYVLVRSDCNILPCNFDNDIFNNGSRATHQRHTIASQVTNTSIKSNANKVIAISNNINNIPSSSFNGLPFLSVSGQNACENTL
jgi:hypothetical protein